MTGYDTGFRDALELCKSLVHKHVQDEELKRLLVKKIDYFITLVNEKRLEKISYYLGSLEQL